MKKQLYDEKYYNSLNYADYMSRQPRYLKLAKETTDLLDQLSLIHKDVNILDYGCSVGFLMSGLKAVGFKHVDGVDVSDWAIERAKEKDLRVTRDINGLYNIYRLMYALDVFEHMKDKEIINIFNKLHPKLLIVRIPCGEGIVKDFHLEVSRRDKTHINCKSREQWIKFLINKCGFSGCLKLNLNTIYDNPGVFCGLFIRE